MGRSTETLLRLNVTDTWQVYLASQRIHATLSVPVQFEQYMIEVSVRYSIFVVSGVFYVYATSLQEVDGNNGEVAEVATSRPVDSRSI